MEFDLKPEQLDSDPYYNERLVRIHKEKLEEKITSERKEYYEMLDGGETEEVAYFYPRLAAARVTDKHECPTTNPDGSPHVGGPILPPCEPTVLVDGLAQARVTDKAKCNGPIAMIVTGSASVFVGGKNAARVEDATSHGGKIIPPCSPTTFIGGPSVGALVGNPEKAEQACLDLAKGRHTGSTDQSFENCGIESSRQLINEKSTLTMSETGLLSTALEKDWAVKVIDPETGAVDINKSGGSTSEQRQAMLQHYGISTTNVDLMNTDFSDLAQAVADGKGVITSHNAGKLWGLGDGGSHAIVLTGVKYNHFGGVDRVFVNDTSEPGECGQELPRERYIGSLRNISPANVTNDPVW